jgi:hypothetical protein
MGGKDIEVAIESLDIDGHMRHGLGAVDEHTSAVAMRDRDHFCAGVTVPSVFETCGNETIRVFGESSLVYSSR